MITAVFLIIISPEVDSAWRIIHMEKKLILEIRVTIDRNEISRLTGPGGSVVLIPFGGTVTGEIFQGRVCPGGVDVQRVNLSGVRHMFARYMLEGSDYTGAACHIYIENNGWFDNGNVPATFRTVPAFVTDSAALAPYLHRNCFVGEGTPDEQGVMIRLYEVMKEQN